MTKHLDPSFRSMGRSLAGLLAACALFGGSGVPARAGLLDKAPVRLPGTSSLGGPVQQVVDVLTPGSLTSLLDPTWGSGSRDPEYGGDINPTNVPIIIEDRYSAAAYDGVDELLGLRRAHALATGRGVVVAVIDGGWTRVEKEGQRSRSWAARDVVDEDDDVLDYGNGLDDDEDGVADRALGHGSFVAGMILRVAPGATVLPLRASDDEGRVKESWVVRAMDHAMAEGAQIINISIEMAQVGAPLRDALQRAVDRGIFIVVSAGNGALAQHMGELADTGLTLAVAATDHDDRVAEFSRSDYPIWENLVYAPGVDLVGPYGSPHRSTYCLWSGTSFSAGLASGALALAAEVLGRPSPSSTISSLRDTCAPVTTAQGMRVFGIGRIDVGRFVERIAAQRR